MSGLTAHIASWSIPGEKSALCINVLVEPLHTRESFYRVQGASDYRPDEWSWRKWSMAGKPTVPVSDECAGLLSRMVMDHPDLSRLLHLFGYSDGDSAKDADGSAT